MIRLGLRLTLQSGREALARLIVTTLAVAAGVTLLLAVLAGYHAFQVNSNRACWECTKGASLAGHRPARGDLWNYSVDYYRGQTIERLGVAALAPGAPVPPGIHRLPAAGDYYASPALAALLASVPRDELGDRFPGTLAGRIGDQALSGPDELVIYVWYRPSALAALPGTQQVTAIQASPGQEVFTPYFRYAFAVGVLAVLFPLLILISTATRLATARREERFAALRLVGATPRDIGVIASVDSVVSALLGAVLGIAVFAVIRPALAGTSLIGTRYFAFTVTPTAWGYAAMVVAVPLAAALASLMSLRRVRVSPLGVSRRVSPPPPSAWRLGTLTAGIVLFVAGLLLTTSKSIGVPAYPGLLIVMIGLVLGGPWLTAAAARVFARIRNGPSVLLATRRLEDNPKAAFRSVSGLVLAVFLGTMVGALLPAVDSIAATPNSHALQNVLLDTFASQDGPSCAQAGPGAQGQPWPGTCSRSAIQAAEGLAPKAGTTLIRQLRTFRGASVFPLYSMPPATSPGGNISVISCSALRQLAVLGQCAPGVLTVEASDQALLFSDNPRNSTKAFVSRANPAYTGRLSGLHLQAVLVRVNDPATLERIRTYLATHTPLNVSSAPGAMATPPRTFGEAVAIRTGRAETVQRLVYVAVALTILVAGCSLAVAVGGGLVDRKRPFALLQVSGTPVGTLYRVVFLEAVLPLGAATVTAAALAYGMSILTVSQMAPPGTPVPLLGHVYYATMGAGLAISLLVIAATLPLLRRITSPSNIRFE